jgi:hypothetical protein
MLSPLFGGLSAARNVRESLRADLAASRAATTAAQARTEVQSMRADIEKLLMITEALWGILKEQHGYTDDELIRRIQEIDLKDGTLDGKVARQPPALCPKCNRAINRNHTSCLYCGQEVQTEPFAR